MFEEDFIVKHRLLSPSWCLFMWTACLFSINQFCYRCVSLLFFWRSFHATVNTKKFVTWVYGLCFIYVCHTQTWFRNHKHNSLVNALRVSLAWYTCILISVGLCVLSCGDDTRIESARKRRKNLSAKRHSNIVFLFVHTLSCRAMNVWIHNNKQPAQMIRRARLLWIHTYTSCMCIIWMCYGVEKYIYKIKIKVKETGIETDRSKSKAVK